MTGEPESPVAIAARARLAQRFETVAATDGLHRRVAEISRARMAALMRHRERYVKAWIAVTGIDPTDAVLFQRFDMDGSLRVWVERK